MNFNHMRDNPALGGLNFNTIKNNPALDGLNFNTMQNNPALDGLNFNLRDNPVRENSVPVRIISKKVVRLKNGQVGYFFVFSNGTKLILDSSGRLLARG